MGAPVTKWLQGRSCKFVLRRYKISSVTFLASLLLHKKFTGLGFLSGGTYQGTDMPSGVVGYKVGPAGGGEICHHPTDICKLSTEKTTGAQNGGFSDPKFVFWSKIFTQEKIFRLAQRRWLDMPPRYAPGWPVKQIRTTAIKYRLHQSTR